MSAKLKSEYIKKKIKATYGDIEVYNPQFKKETYDKLSQMIKENSMPVVQQGMSDIQVNNMTKIFRQALISLTNIENEEYWNDIDDIELESMINLADGDFKQTVNCLIDLVLEIAQDNRILEIRKINVLNDKLIELKEAIEINANMENTLNTLGLTKEQLAKLQSGDKEAFKEFQDNLAKSIQKQIKPKRKYNKKNK
jgi:hypothetical protein